MDQEMQKITVEVPRALLQEMKNDTGLGTTEVVRDALERSHRIRAFQELRKLRGSFTPSISVEEMRSWEDDE